MAIEARRGCGYRKVGGLYLVSEPGGLPCDRLPFPLTVCPVCSCGIKQTRGWTWVIAKTLFGGAHLECSDDLHRHHCPVCNGEIERAGLIWIGTQFYPTPESFTLEAYKLGISRRLTAVPRDFKLGETWVLVAHPKALRVPADRCEKLVEGTENMKCSQIEGHTTKCRRLASDLEIPARKDQPGIFQVWKPQRIEKILLESERGSEEAKKLEERGITPVFVPDNDKDHQGSVYDKDEEPPLPLVTVGDEPGIQGYDFE